LAKGIRRFFSTKPVLIPLHLHGMEFVLGLPQLIAETIAIVKGSVEVVLLLGQGMLKLGDPLFGSREKVVGRNGFPKGA
jgi:hypothetical protein